MKVGLARMLKGGVILDMINAVEAKNAKEAGAVAVMALEHPQKRWRASGPYVQPNHHEVHNRL